MNLLLEFVLLVLATQSLLDVWFFGEIFAARLTRLEWWDADPDSRPWWMWPRWFWSFWLGAYMCPYCMSYHVTFWLAALMTAVHWRGCLHWSHLVRYLVSFLLYWLAVQRGTWILNAMLPEHLKLDRPKLQ